jgi:hypothetical protein
MKTIHVQQATTAKDLFGQAEGEPVLLHEQSGRAFVLVEVDKDDAETFALAGNDDLDRLLEHSRARAKHEGWLSTEQLRAEFRE